MTDSYPGGNEESPADAQLVVRLEEIFMPEARRQRSEAYARQYPHENTPVGKPIRLAHYTSAEAGLSIVRSKRVWMRNATCMSDYREVTHGITMLKQAFLDSPKFGYFRAAMDYCVSGVATDALQNFRHWSEESAADGIHRNTYVASLSEHEAKEDRHGRLSMWRAFGGAAARVAIVLNVPYYSGAAAEMRLIFSPVAYLDESEVSSVVDKIIANVRRETEFLKTVSPRTLRAFIFQMMLAGATCLKHKGFEEEREWRAIHVPRMMPSSLIGREICVIAGVPQPVYVVPLDERVSKAISGLDLSRILDRIIIGPTQYPWALREAFAAALGEAGVPNASERVIASEIPIRS